MENKDEGKKKNTFLLRLSFSFSDLKGSISSNQLPTTQKTLWPRPLPRRKILSQKPTPNPHTRQHSAKSPPPISPGPPHEISLHPQSLGKPREFHAKDYCEGHEHEEVDDVDGEDGPCEGDCELGKFGEEGVGGREGW